MLAAACRAPADPEAAIGPAAGDLLVDLSGAYSFRDAAQDPERERLRLQTSAGFFVNPAHRVGLSFDGELVNDETFDEHLFAIGPFYDYNVPIGRRTTFYVGPQVQWASVDLGEPDESSDSVAWGVHVGLRHWLSPRVALVLEPRWMRADFGEDFGGEADQFDVLLGLAVTMATR